MHPVGMTAVMGQEQRMVNSSNGWRSVIRRKVLLRMWSESEAVLWFLLRYPFMATYTIVKQEDWPRFRKLPRQGKQVNTWILHESEAFICKAPKGKAIVAYAEPVGFTKKLIHNFRRWGARLARRENAGISRYSELSQRSQTGCIGV